MLFAWAEVIDNAWRMRGHGAEGECRIHWPGLIAFKRTFTDPVPEKQESSASTRCTPAPTCAFGVLRACANCNSASRSRRSVVGRRGFPATAR